MVSRTVFTSCIITALFLAALLQAVCPAIAADVPQALTYQGKLTYTSGQIVPDGNYPMWFRLFDAQNGGSQLWSSGTAVSVAVSGGVFTAELQPIGPATLGSADVWLEVQPDGGVALPRVRLSSAPFALRAADLALPFEGSVSSTGSALSITNTGGGPAISAVGLVDLQGDLYVGGRLGVGTPSPQPFSTWLE